MPEPSPFSLTSHVARMVRHEVGDLLQAIYSTTAILQTRLPKEMELERQLLTSLKARGEQLKIQLDAITQLVSPPTLQPTTVELCPLVEAALARLRREKPGLVVEYEPFFGAVWVDRNRLSEALHGLFTALSEGAVVLQVRALYEPGDTVVLTLLRQGNPANEDQLEWLIEPFKNSRFTALGLQLACMAQILRAMGGQILACNMPEGLEINLHFALPLR